MKIKVNEVKGKALDYLVGKCEHFSRHAIASLVITNSYSPTTNWAQAGPIIERERIALSYDTRRFGWVASFYDGDDVFGGTPLIAAMRCYVASKLGDEVDESIEMRYSYIIPLGDSLAGLTFIQYHPEPTRSVLKCS